MSKFTTIYKVNSAYGGYEFRATSDGIDVNLQEMSPSSSSFRTILTISKEDFDVWAEKEDIYNPYNQDPALLDSFINQIKREDDLI